MRKSTFPESQIVAILQEAEAGVPVAELLRKHGISRAVVATLVQNHDLAIVRACRKQPVRNRTWALDCMGDTLYDGRCYRTLNVLDEGSRDALAIEISPSLPSVRVVRLLAQLVAVHGAPTALRCDNGPELIAEALTSWCAAQGIVLQHIQPGKPNQNAFIERFNRTYRTEVLDAWVFTSVAGVRQVTDE